MNTTFLRIELLRVLRDPSAVFFTIVLPIFFYVIFGAAQSSTNEKAGNGNVAMIVMIAMAAYAAATAAVGTSSFSVLERIQGWGRQLGLTPMTNVQYVGIKTILATTFSAIALIGVFITGFITRAEATFTAWLTSFAILLAGSLMFALYGLALALRFRSESAASAASGSIVIMGFLGNVFFPLSGTLLDIARFTPMYGYVALSKYPVAEGWSLESASGQPVHEALWIPLTNFVVWFVIFAVLAVWSVSRSRERL